MDALIQAVMWGGVVGMEKREGHAFRWGMSKKGGERDLGLGRQQGGSREERTF